ncbi:MAG: hypothetical protein N3A68_05690 [Bacteroidia bacterium]|nr:hypothetical protein [Bacteroidia bacterium]
MKRGFWLLLGWVWAQDRDSLPEYFLDSVPIVSMSPQAISAASTQSGPEKVAQLLPDLKLVYRSVPFAQEVVYQGFLPQQMQVTIEGMRVVPACVDKMDPVLTFTEASSIAGASWENRQAWGATPTLSAQLLSATGPSGGNATIAVSDNYNRFFCTARHRQTSKRWAFASGLTLRYGGSYRTGNTRTPGVAWDVPAWAKDTLFDLNPFKKAHLYATASYQISPQSRVELSYLGDYLYDVAYPALIMDTRHSAMHLARLRYLWGERVAVQVYGNTVFHDMTDEGRSESEIRQRIVMPGMHMPMKGLTRTAGASSEIRWWQQGPFTLHHHAEYSYSTASADMTMYPLSGGTPMFLRNLSDIRFQQASTHLSLRYQKPPWQIHPEAGVTYLQYAVGDTLHFAPLRVYQEYYAGQSYTRSAFWTYQGKLSLGYTRKAHTFQLSTQIGTRPPTHTELYAYYLYVPMDNSIQMGNSALVPEKLLRTETSYRYQREAFHIEIRGFYNYLWAYIAPITFLRAGSLTNATLQAWRLLRNTGEALTTGFTLTSRGHLASGQLIEGWAGYTYGWHVSLHEPLPWIYPLWGRLRFTQLYKSHRFTTEVYAAAAQKRLSRTIYIEDFTPAYALVHLRYSYHLPLHRFSQTENLAVFLDMSVENLLNTYGWDHLSVGNMPFLGRTVTLALRTQW